MAGAPAARTFGELLRVRVEQKPDALAYRFLSDLGGGFEDITRAQLMARAGRVAAGLAQHVQPGDRVLLLCATGLSYVVAFHGCLLAGAIAVPAYPPRGNRHAFRVMQIVRDCAPACILSDAENLPALQRSFAEAREAGLAVAPLVSVDALLSAEGAAPAGVVDVAPGAPAFLQYTSGSTGTPKGVMVSHANILANLGGISAKFEVDPSYRTVFWLPPYHDMGLVGGILHPVFGGYPVTLMSPVLFIQSPVRWLAAISADRATASAAPNFGFQACVDRITPEQASGLDLSSWQIAICGGERVMWKTMRDFARKFEPYGFDSRAIYPTYGMAEATLLMTGGRKGGGCSAIPALAAGGEGPAYADVVSCGTPMEGHTLHVVDPETRIERNEGEVGEVWYAGPSVAAGYWNRQAGDFEGRIEGLEGIFLRTGDLGTVIGGELHILGRTKEMIIVRGQNLYPTDLELAVADAHPAINGSAIAAFAGQQAGAEGVVLALEIRREARKAPVEDIRKAVVRALVEAFDIRPIDVVLLRPSGVLRTSSGKIRRAEMAQGYAAGELAVHAPPEN